MKKYFLNHFIIFPLIVIALVFINAKISLAQESLMYDTRTLTPSACKVVTADSDETLKQYCGAYKVDDFIILGIKATKIILGLVGTLAFGAFIYGGVMFLISAGRKDFIDKGKSAMTNAVIGLVIVFSSYLIIQFTLQTIGYLDENGNIKGTTTNWNRIPPK